MLVQIFGAIDLIAAALLYSGKFPAPGFIVSACILVLVLKGIISIYPVPLFLPGVLMSAADVTAAALLYFGTTPLPVLKTAVIFVLLVKSIPSIISALFLVAGFVGSRRK